MHVLWNIRVLILVVHACVCISIGFIRMYKYEIGILLISVCRVTYLETFYWRVLCIIRVAKIGNVHHANYHTTIICYTAEHPLFYSCFKTLFFSVSRCKCQFTPNSPCTGTRCETRCTQYPCRVCIIRTHTHVYVCNYTLLFRALTAAAPVCASAVSKYTFWMTKWFPRPSIYIILLYAYTLHKYIIRDDVYIYIYIHIGNAAQNKPCRWRTSGSPVINCAAA